MPAELDRGQEPAARVVLNRRAANEEQLPHLFGSHQLLTRQPGGVRVHAPKSRQTPKDPPLTCRKRSATEAGVTTRGQASAARDGKKHVSSYVVRLAQRLPISAVKEFIVAERLAEADPLDPQHRRWRLLAADESHSDDLKCITVGISMLPSVSDDGSLVPSPLRFSA